MIQICHVERMTIHEMPRVLRESKSALQAGMKVNIVGIGESLDWEGIRFIGHSHARNRLNRFFSTSRKMIDSALRTDSTIIQIHSPEFLLYARKIKKAGKVLIFDSHEFYGYQIMLKEYISKPLRQFVSRIYSQFEEYVCKKYVDCVLYPCTVDGKNYFENRAKHSVKIENYSMIHQIQESEKKDQSVIYAGSLTYQRGITHLISAIMQTNACLRLCGSFPSEEYQKSICKALIPGKIEYLGLMDRNQLFEQYSKASVGISTLLPVGQYHHIDNLSTKIYEYMQCGLPVVMSNFPYAVRMNEEYHFGICVDPTNPKEIAEAINELLKHPEQAKEMGRRGKETVKKVFNWEVESQKLIEIYNKAYVS